MNKINLNKFDKCVNFCRAYALNIALAAAVSAVIIVIGTTSYLYLRG